MKRKHIFIPLFVFIGAGVISLVASIIDFKAVNPILTYSRETVQFDYDGASDGKDPNGNPFNAVDFLSDKVIEAGLAKAQLNYDVETVRKNIAVENVIPDNIVDDIVSFTSLTNSNSITSEITSKDYHPVRYRFTLYSGVDKNISASKLNTLLDGIVEAYCDEFYQSYKNTIDVSVFNEFYAIDEYDYVYQAQIYTNEFKALMNYADSLYNEQKDFMAENQSFKDVYLRCQQLIANDVARIENTIVIHALSKNLDRLKEYYTYRIEKLNYDKIKYTADLDAITAQLESYAKDSTIYVGSGNGLIAIESNSSKTYDALLSQQIALSNKIGLIDVEIAECASILNDINNNIGSEEEYLVLKNYLQRLGVDYKEIQELFIKMIDAFNQERVFDKTITKSAVSYRGSSLLSSSFIVRCIKVSAPIMLVVMLGISIYFLVRAAKKEKQANK